MADTFFDFDTSISHGDNSLSLDDADCIETEEEEYDALNDETFGALEDVANLDDWEQQHEQLAEIAESSRQSEQLENSITQLVLDDSDDSEYKETIWNYGVKSNKNGEVFNSTLLPNLQKLTEKTGNKEKLFNNTVPLSGVINRIPKTICTVEELERGLLNSRQKHNIPPNIQHPMFQRPPMHRLPPGLMNVPPLRNFQPMPPMPPGWVGIRPPCPLIMPNNPQHRMIGHAPQFPVNHPYNFLLPPRNLINHMSRTQQPRMRNDYRPSYTPTSEILKDEYAGLMTTREKQWLLNIQLLQLNTGTPYFDDYYYTVFKERKMKNNKENHQQTHERRYNRGNRDFRNNERQDNVLQSRVYTPLQFENSLGKLQCGSVTAPRKIIDMDVVTLEKDGENVLTHRDTRKTKQLLLELESMYSLILKAEDLRNPLALSNMEKVCELKQKQRLRELEAASTSEQKQEILKLLQQESVPVVENPQDYLIKVVNGLLQDDKYTSFLNIRKGKMLLMRLLPHLTVDAFASQLFELWLKVLLGIAKIGRKDSIGDNVLQRLHPFFKRYIQTCKMSNVLEIVSNITNKKETLRSTPLIHQGKSPLYFIIGNKFGVSSLATLFVRSEYLISSENASEAQQKDWYSFVVCWSETVSMVNNVAVPIEPIPHQVFVKHCNRIVDLTPELRLSLENKFVDST